MQILNTYTAGWASRGPIGVIASTMYDSYSTIDLLLADFQAAVVSKHLVGGLSSNPPPGPPPEISEAKGRSGKQRRVVGYEEWKRIEGVEKEEGEKRGKTAEKFLEVERMLEVGTLKTSEKKEGRGVQDATRSGPCLPRLSLELRSGPSVP